MNEDSQGEFFKTRHLQHKLFSHESHKLENKKPKVYLRSYRRRNVATVKFCN